MVKPPKTMQPEHRQSVSDKDEKPTKNKRGFQPDSFHDYMARKIELQRKQFGLALPPPPPRPPPPPPQQAHNNLNKTDADNDDDLPPSKRQQSSTTTSASSPNDNDNDNHYSGSSTTTTTTPRKVQFTTTGTKHDDLEAIRRSAEMRAKAKSRRSGSSSSSFSSSSFSSPSSSERLGNNKRRIRRLSTSSPPTSSSLPQDASTTTTTTTRYYQSPSSSPSFSLESTSPASTSPAASVHVPKGILKPRRRTTSWSANNKIDDRSIINDDNVDGKHVNPSDCSSNAEQETAHHYHDDSTTKHHLTTVSDPDTGPDPNIDPTMLFPSPSSLKRSRPDLFFLGIVVKTQGYTNPDDETLKRMLHAHGGDLEKYETTKITHLVAETLSTAKAAYLRQQKRPVPVVHPSWIVDSVKATKLLPYGNYLLKELSDDYHDGGTSKQLGIQSMFAKQQQQQQQHHHQQQQNNNNERHRHHHHQQVQEHEQFELNLSRTPNDNHAPRIESTANDDTTTTTTTTLQHEPVSKTSDVIIPKTTAASRSTSEEVQQPPVNEIDPKSSPSTKRQAATNSRTTTGRTDDRLINGKVRTVGTDPNFLDSYFANSRLSYIGSYKQRMVSTSPSKKPRTTTNTGSNNNKPKHGTGTRFVFHVDMDCFFAAVVLRNFPEFQDKPVVISHHGKKARDNPGVGSSHLDVIDIPKDSTSECATCNYEARKYGIKKGMFLSRAKALCPDLVVLAYDFEGYEDVSRQVEEIVDAVATQHQGEVEVVSCDEAYIEMFFDDEGPFFSLHDRAFDVAEKIRSKIFETTQCTASIGVARNKFLAKLGGDKVKPNGSYVVREYQDLLKDLRLRDLHGVGWRTEPKLADEGLFTVQDVWDLGPRAESQLVRILGIATGKKIFGFCHGEDDRPVKSKEQKSIGAECNYGVRFDGPYGIDHFMLGLAKEVSKRMEGCGVTATKLTLKLKKRKENAGPPPKFLGHGSCYNLSKSTEIQMTRDVEIIRNAGMKLFRSFDVELDDVRGMGISMSGLTMRQDDRSNGTSRGAFEMQQWLRNGETSSGADDIESGELETLDTDNTESNAEDTGIPSINSPLPNRNPARDNPIVSRSTDDHGSKKPDNHRPAPKISSKKRKKNPSSSSSSSSKSSLLSKNGQKGRFLQTDLKRMMKLQAVQSGQEKMDVSLSVLDDLPLHLRLQVVNNDDQKLGSNSQRRSMSTSTRIGESRRHSQPSSEIKYRLKDSDKEIDLVADTAHDSSSSLRGRDAGRLPSERSETDFSFLIAKEVSNVYEEDILPLRHFLDQNSPNSKTYSEDEQTAVDLVKIYIGTVVKEGRLGDTVSILRSIRKRHDHWSVPSVLEQIAEECSKAYGMDDDIGVDWLEN